MTPNELLALIDPKISPKYSPNLHAWIKKRWGHLSINLVVTNPNEWGSRYIGHLDPENWLGASNLMGVLCNGAKEETFAIPNHYGIDETFIDRYVRDGRCAIDTGHRTGFIGDESRWVVVPAHGDQPARRECQWCRHHVQVNLGWTEVINKSEWVGV